jgi:hypothetical protein
LPSSCICIAITLVAGSQWLKPVILATQEAEIRRIAVPSSGKWFVRPYLKKPFTKKELVEWLKV